MALNLAVAKGRTDIVKCLVENGAQLDAKDEVIIDIYKDAYVSNMPCDRTVVSQVARYAAARQWAAVVKPAVTQVMQCRTKNFPRNLLKSVH